MRNRIRNVLTLLMAMMTTVTWAQMPDFTEIVEESASAVVKILVESKTKPFQGGGVEQLPPPLHRLFEFRGKPPQGRTQQNLGSGFIVSKDGYIVTNNHVVENATSVTVRLIDRREYDADVIGTDPRSDLALLKIDETGLETLEFGSGDIDVGEWVLAIGSPFGLDFSVTAGIVSAKGRSLPTESGENYVPFIQTDVAINPGNSGGPLFNLDGDVVGVNSQIFTRNGGSIGLSFAIPAAVVRDVIEQLRDSGEVIRGWLGLGVQDINSSLAESFDLDRPRGALVAQVDTDSPADLSGIKTGDIILEFDGEVIETSSDLPHLIGLIRPDTKVKALVLREGRKKMLIVGVGARPGVDQLVSVAGSKPSKKSSANVFGMMLDDTDPRMMEKLGLSGGVIVLGVKRDSPAAKANILNGDIITRLGNHVIQDVGDMNDVIARLRPGQSVAVRLIRNGIALFLAIRIPQSGQ